MALISWLEPQGSPLQLILSSVFHVDTPPGNIPVTEARQLSTHPMVAETIPLALGDSYEQYRIVGSTPALLEHYQASFSQGTVWNETYEAVVGAQVALEAGVVINDELVSAHGIGGGDAHADHPLKVVGILEPTGTVVDRLVLTDVVTVWAVHGSHVEDEEHHDEEHHDEEHHDEEHHDEEHPEDDDHDEAVVAAEEDLEYTSLIVKYKTPIAAATLPRYINKETSMQAAAPVFPDSSIALSFRYGYRCLSHFRLCTDCCRITWCIHRPVQRDERTSL